MMMRLALAAAAILATTACATAFVPDLDTPDTRPVLPSAAEDTCNARQYAALIGQPVTSPGVPPADRHVRHIRPDSAVTMDLSEQRLNVLIDKADRIYALRCF